MLFRSGPAAAYGNGSSVFFGETMTVAFALVLASVLIRGEATPIGRALASRLAVGLGTISYGIYLWHGAAYPQMERLAVWGNAPVDVGLLAAVSVAFATASWFLIERPALRLKVVASAPAPERAPTAPPVAGVAV